MSDICPGDIIHIRASVIERSPAGAHVEIRGADNNCLSWCSLSEIVHVEPRPIKAGEIVKLIKGIGCGDTVTWVVLAAHDKMLWLYREDKYCSVNLGDVRRC